MLSAVQNIIPLVTSAAGLCLTAENWQEAQVTAISYSLESLLHKPGVEILKKIPDFAHYVGWPCTLIINAASLVANKEGVYVSRSPYDGSKVTLNTVDLITLLQHLKPTAVILPKNMLRDCPQIWSQWIESIIPFIHVDELEHHSIEREHGVYFNYSDKLTASQLGRWSHLPNYVMGAIDANAIEDLRAKGIQLIETDEPAKAALHGIVYNSTGKIDLTQDEARMQFEIIDADCACPSCVQQFTKAYFHHLLEQTPLLCQRLLIQHNVFWMAKRKAFKRCPQLGLYPIVDSVEWVELLLKEGVKTIQLRIKEKTDTLEQIIKQSILLAKKHNALLFVNDHWELALKLGAQGVHLGQEDLNTADIHAIQQQGLYLGLSAYCAAEVKRALVFQPSYIAIGPIYPTHSKDLPFAAHGVEQLKYWQLTLNYPLVAIGGINQDHIADVVATGVNGIAVISAITQAEDPKKATQELLSFIAAQ